MISAIALSFDCGRVVGQIDPGEEGEAAAVGREQAGTGLRGGGFAGLLAEILQRRPSCKASGTGVFGWSGLGGRIHAAIGGEEKESCFVLITFFSSLTSVLQLAVTL